MKQPEPMAQSEHPWAHTLLLRIARLEAENRKLREALRGMLESNCAHAPAYKATAAALLRELGEG